MKFPTRKKIEAESSSLPTSEPVTTPQPTKSGPWHEALITIVLFISAILIALIAKAYIVQPYVVDGQSMETTLQDHDRLLVDKLPLTFAHLSGHPYIPARGDIIIFNQSNLPGYIGTKQLIKRVIGLPGERVVVDQGVITIYNRTHPNGFNPDTTGKYRISASTTPGNVDVTLQNNQLFVCGDNRPNSEDSRVFGPIDSSQIVGKLSFRIFPLSKLQHF